MMRGHISRVGVLAWTNGQLASGSRDRSIYVRDVRAPQDWTSMLVGSATGSHMTPFRLAPERVHKSYDHLLCNATLQVGHKQEVCGLKWSFDDQQLASGGNDNKLLIWNAHSTSPILKFGQHTAAVKAIAWNPHQAGVLASGGGTADRNIRFWNTAQGCQLNAVRMRNHASFISSIVWFSLLVTIALT
jgi:cell division cycle 20-like protein 1 (cofactor of APC complex)